LSDVTNEITCLKESTIDEDNYGRIIVVTFDMTTRNIATIISAGITVTTGSESSIISDVVHRLDRLSVIRC